MSEARNDRREAAARLLRQIGDIDDRFLMEAMEEQSAAEGMAVEQVSGEKTSGGVVRELVRRWSTLALTAAACLVVLLAGNLVPIGTLTQKSAAPERVSEVSVPRADAVDSAGQYAAEADAAAEAPEASAPAQEAAGEAPMADDEEPMADAEEFAMEEYAEEADAAAEAPAEAAREQDIAGKAPVQGAAGEAPAEGLTLTPAVNGAKQFDGGAEDTLTGIAAEAEEKAKKTSETGSAAETAGVDAAEDSIGGDAVGGSKALSPAEKTIAVLLFLAAALFAGLSLISFLEKGIPLNNAYLFATRREKERMDKKPVYRQSAVVFALVSVLFLLIGLSVTLQNERILLWEIPVLVGMFIYAIVSSVRMNRKDR